MLYYHPLITAVGHLLFIKKGTSPHCLSVQCCHGYQMTHILSNYSKISNEYLQDPKIVNPSLTIPAYICGSFTYETNDKYLFRCFNMHAIGTLM